MILGATGAAFCGSSIYERSGLVAWWDGIWNSGYNVHNSVIDTWKDLAGSRDMTIVSGATVGATGITSGSSGIARSTDTSALGAEYYEIVFDPSAFSGSGCVFSFADYPNGNFDTFGLLDNARGSCSSRSNAAYPTYNVSRIKSTIQLDMTTGATTQNCYSVSTISTNYWTISQRQYFYIGARNTGSSPFTGGVVHCIRAYSRKLTSDEAEYNYKIDKIRFGV